MTIQIPLVANTSNFFTKSYDFVIYPTICSWYCGDWS